MKKCKEYPDKCQNCGKEYVDVRSGRKYCSWECYSSESRQKSPDSDFFRRKMERQYEGIVPKPIKIHDEIPKNVEYNKRIYKRKCPKCKKTRHIKSYEDNEVCKFCVNYAKRQLRREKVREVKSIEQRNRDKEYWLDFNVKRIKEINDEKVKIKDKE